MIFGIYKLQNAENETMLNLCHYVNSYSPEGAINMSTFYLHYSSFYFILFFTLKQCILFSHSFLKLYSKQTFAWFCYLVVFISTLHFANSYLFYLVLLLKITLVFSTVHGDGKNLTRL